MDRSRNRTTSSIYVSRGGNGILVEEPDLLRLKGHNLTCSMSGVGSCADNAACEGFFGILKRERVNRRRYDSHADARADIFDYIECFYNPRRRRKMAGRTSVPAARINYK